MTYLASNLIVGALAGLAGGLLMYGAWSLLKAFAASERENPFVILIGTVAVLGFNAWVFLHYYG